MEPRTPLMHTGPRTLQLVYTSDSSTITRAAVLQLQETIYFPCTCVRDSNAEMMMKKNPDILSAKMHVKIINKHVVCVSDSKKVGFFKI